jgi:hypothetical protein
MLMVLLLWHLAHTGTVKILSHTSAWTWSGLSQPRHPAGTTNICACHRR